MAKQKVKKHSTHRGTPQGMRYADVLAAQRHREEMLEAAAKDTMIKVQSDIRCQRQLWLCCCAMNDAFGIGPERFQKFAEALQNRTDWWVQMAEDTDDEYANEKLRLEAQRISGSHIEYLYEHELLAAEKRLIEEGVRE